MSEPTDDEKLITQLINEYDQDNDINFCLLSRIKDRLKALSDEVTRLKFARDHADDEVAQKNTEIETYKEQIAELVEKEVMVFEPQAKEISKLTAEISKQKAFLDKAYPQRCPNCCGREKCYCPEEILKANNKALNELVESVYRVVKAVKINGDSDTIKVVVIEKLITKHKETTNE